MRILLLMLLSQCKPWLPLLAAGPETGVVVSDRRQDSVLPVFPDWVFHQSRQPQPVFPAATDSVQAPLLLHTIPPAQYFWQPQTISYQPCFTVTMPDSRVDSLKKVVDSMAGLQRAQLRADSLLQVQLKQQQQRFSSLQQAHADTLREKSWFRAASMVLGGIFLIGLIWVGWRYRVRASP